MITHFYRHMAAMTLLILFWGVLPAQSFQLLHTYDIGSGPVSGTYHDVVNLSAFANVAGASVAVGHTDIIPERGVITEMRLDGSPKSTVEVTNPSNNPVTARAICRTPNDDVIACFYDPVTKASDIIRYSTTAGLIWARRLPDFIVEDVIADSAAVPTGLGIWLIGQSVSGNLAMEGLNSLGGPIFAREFNLTNPNWAYQNTIGFQIKLNPNNSRLMVVGSATFAGVPRTEMLVLQTSLNGNLNWARGYANPNGNYRGKCITPIPTSNNQYAVAFEYSSNTLPQAEIGCMRINSFGNISWIRSYPGIGFFSGSNFSVEAMDARDNRLLMAGNFTPWANPIETAYSFSLRISGNPVQFNEYQTNGFFPAGETAFHGLDFNRVSQQHVIVGKFTNADIGGDWPWGVNPNAFWAIGADRLGISECNTDVEPPSNNLTPLVTILSNISALLPQMTQSPLDLKEADPDVVKQCASGKRHNPIEAQERGDIRVAYQKVEGQITLEVQGEMTGAGRIQLLNLQGQVLTEQAAIAGKQTLNTSLLSQGVYLVRYSFPGIGQGVKKVMIW